MIALVDAVPDDRLADDLRYKLMTGAEGATPRDLVLLTLFNHQTHHRGQVHALLTRAGIKPPPLDIVVFLDEAPEVLAEG